MGDSYRIKTELGINKSINVQLDQEFEFLEILSLKIQQTDIYTRSCADYGVLVGRVTANNGFGLPNARVSIFIPIEEIDESNPLITSIYPYKSPNDKNEDGYRYNLLPYTPSYSKHSATGTLPSRSDVLTGGTAVEIYDKYYRFTTKTNDSGDYMIMGVPLGQQTIVMDVDLSDIGEFSLTPQDLIRIGLATEAQVAGNKFRTSSDLNSLPQIINLVKNAEISPLWGDPEICDISINRLDFDLRDDANVDIQPTSVFMGSIFSTEDNFRLRSNRILGNELGCRPRDNMGNLCDLIPGPGQILAIRQTIQQDENGNPVLEVYELEQAGNVIDGDGTWIVELPMNLDYFITNEFGEKVISSDTTVGIPSKAKYRFKIKWQQSPGLSQQTRRASFLIPNVREYGWISSGDDPNYSTSVVATNKLKSSYYFGLDWNGYVTGFTSSERIQKLNEIIDCQDTFYEFKFNRVYTVSNLIDQYKKGGRGRFIGIKEIDDSSCNSTVNKFPANDGFKNFNILFFVFSLLMQVIQIISIPLLIVVHVAAFMWNLFVKLKPWIDGILAILTGYFLFQAGKFFITFIKEKIKAKKDAATAIAVAALPIFGAILAASYTLSSGLAVAAALQALGLFVKNLGIAAAIGGLLIALNVIFRLVKGQPVKGFNLPVITYPDCASCDCGGEDIEPENSSLPLSTLVTQFSSQSLYYNNLVSSLTQLGISNENSELAAGSFSSTIGGNDEQENNNQVYKVMKSDISLLTDENNSDITYEFFSYSRDIPFGERINNFNLRQKYFNGSNRISVSFDTNLNKHYDNTLVLIYDAPLDSGTLLTFVNPLLTRDVNATYTGNTGPYVRGIGGTPLNPGDSTYVVEYCDPSNQLNNLSVSYLLNTGSTITNYKFPSDVEYFQVLTGITVADASNLWDSSTIGSLPNIMNSGTQVILSSKIPFIGWNETNFSELQIKNLFESFSEKYILILQRGVDPYSPLYNNKYGLGKLFGLVNEDDLTITANTRLNIPIQKLPDSTISVQKFTSQNNIFYPSHFFAGDASQFSGFTTSLVGYYGGYDASNRPPNSSVLNVNGVNCFVSSTSNKTWDSGIDEPARYTTSEDLSGGGYYFLQGGREPDLTKITYNTSVLLPSLTANPMSITSRINNVMRTDRLPSSDVLDGSSWDYNPALLQQNLGFGVYVIDDEGNSTITSNFSTGADISNPDIVGQYASSNVFETLNTCSQTVSLGCYEGFGTDFQVNENCADKDAVIGGCYQFLKRPLLDIGKDSRNFNEWAYRWRFFYGLCQGVLSQSFVNNWINGALYMYPIQINTIFDSQNKPQPPIFCKDVIYFESDTNNFYYRSSPFNEFTNKFVGKLATQVGSLNDLNLQSPTTIINLGMKDSFYNEIILGDGDTGAYVMNQMNSTSYGDPSDLINLFVISRITDEKFLQRIISGKDNGIDQLFSRPDLRIDGDLAQLLSINSELGVIKFSPEFYQIVPNQLGPVEVLGTPSNPVVAVWFSSTTEDLQVKDYLTPGRINFRTNDNSVNYPYPYGIKSQIVPFYQWKLTNQNTIFGSQLNNWATNYVDLVQDRYYQSQDRTSLETPNYFRPLTSSVSDLYARGYIFSVDAAGGYSTIGASSGRFIVGAPFHFYFGLVKGNSALDKFKTKYSVDE
jgi:lipid-A-disaccharide synthase-like uncharacterized protein